jgi:hydroxymethylbilane synthase
VGAIEEALLRGEIDFAVHSYKDLPTDATPGLVVAAVPVREVAHDVLITRAPAQLDALPAGWRIGTSSPRRAAQLRRCGPVTVVPIRGNVPTRIAKVEQGLVDGVVLAAAGVTRLGLGPAHRIDLPIDRFVPAPAQGALAVQARVDDKAGGLAGVVEDRATRLATDAERAFLAATGAGCHVPVGAYATVASGGRIELLAQLFSEDGSRVAEGKESGEHPERIGAALAERLRSLLR